MDIVVIASALKRGTPEHDIVHAFRHAIRVFPVGDSMKMVIGGTTNGELLEVGYIEEIEWTYVIVHAMPARKKFLRLIMETQEGGDYA